MELCIQRVRPLQHRDHCVASFDHFLEILPAEPLCEDLPVFDGRRVLVHGEYVRVLRDVGDAKRLKQFSVRGRRLFHPVQRPPSVLDLPVQRAGGGHTAPQEPASVRCRPPYAGKPSRCFQEVCQVSVTHFAQRCGR